MLTAPLGSGLGGIDGLLGYDFFVGNVVRIDYLRSRVEAFKGSVEWRAVTLIESLPVSKTAVIICDMWDKHW